MNPIIYDRINSNSYRQKTEDNNSVLKLSGSRILGNITNKKKNYNSPHKNIEDIKLKIKLPNNQLLTIANDHLPSYRKLQLNLEHKNNTISTDYKSGKNILLKSININNSNPNKNSSSKLYLKTENENISESKNNINKRDNFALLHEIKKIKKKVDLSHRDRSIKNIMSNKIVFDKKNEKVALKPIKIINDFQDFPTTEVSKRNNIFSFLTEKAKISRKNVLIKLLLDQKDSYDKTIEGHQKMLTDMEKNISIDENVFESLITNQKVSTKKLDELLEKLLLRKRNLLIQLYSLKSKIRTRLDERQKILEQINEYRIVAKFVTKALGGRGSLFEFRLTTYGNTFNLDNDLISEKETQRVLQRFHFLLNFDPNMNYANQDDIDIFLEVSSLNYNDMLFHQLWIKEDFILNNLRKKELLDKEKITFEEGEEKKITYLENKIKILEKELKYNEEILQSEQNEYEKIFKKSSSDISEFEEMISDLYSYVFDTNKNSKSKSLRKYTEIFDVDLQIVSLKKILIRKEELINKLLSNINKYENEDKILFHRVLNNIKEENKQMYVSNMKKIMESGGQNKLKLLKIPKDKIILKYRRSEPPYHLIKKEKKFKLDPELIKQLENQELLTYE